MNDFYPLLSLLGEWLTKTLVILGGAFYLAGTVGLLRFPDLFTRLHALTKADNLGLGLLCFGLAWQANSLTVALKLLLIWLLALLASAVSCHLIARYALCEQRTSARGQS
jgi:multicomponent Na+:H+ antiporter subunit G